MRIAVGTLNPVKLTAARTVLTKIYPHASLLAVNVPSGVSAQPTTDEETIRGAINRAFKALHHAQADLGIGLEGGLSKRPFGTFTSEWCAVVDSPGRIWLGGGANMLVPSTVVEQVTIGHELGTAIDGLLNLQSSKTGPGAIGVLTRGLMNRRRSYEAVIAYAVAPLVSPDIYVIDRSTGIEVPNGTIFEPTQARIRNW